MPARIKVEKGERYGRLSIIKEVKKRKGRRYFLCECDCGTRKEVRFVNLRSGHSKSCGCLRDERNRTSNLQHGKYGTGIYNSWHSMKQRCSNENNATYKYYGARAITFCDQWEDFQPFYDWAMDNGYKEGLTIERIDVNGNYCPGNCTWITQEEQLFNTRNSIKIEFNGEVKCLKEWWREIKEDINISYQSLSKRLNNGWSIERAFTEPKNEKYDSYA